MMELCGSVRWDVSLSRLTSQPIYMYYYLSHRVVYGGEQSTQYGLNGLSTSTHYGSGCKSALRAEWSSPHRS